MSSISKVSVSIPGIKEDTYPIVIGDGILKLVRNEVLSSDYSKVVVVVDLNVNKHHEPLIKEAFPEAVIFAFEAIEKNKNISKLEEIWTFFSEVKLDRKSLVINIGGGVLGDLSGFAAATYMRGIDFIQVPTTLLSQSDASVGGKLGINFSGVKNLIGAFNQPKAVVVDTKFLETLPTRELISGEAEIIKHGLISDAKHFESIEDNFPSLNEKEKWQSILNDTITIKANVVSLDEKEGGLRKILNFGHTAGHAFESLSHKNEIPLLHGEAVALGMIFEAKLSNLRGVLLEADLKRIEKAIEKAGFSVKFVYEFSFDDFLDVIKMDKKNVSGNIKWTLLAGIGQAIFDQEVKIEHVEEVYSSICN